MDLSRRHFVALGSVAALSLLLGPTLGGAAGPSDDGAVDAGPLSEFDHDGVYPRFRAQGFFIVRRGGALVAQSSICTHRGCKLDPRPDGSFHCKCHGSNFNAEGKVIDPPARRDLHRLGISVDASRHVLVDPSKHFTQDQFDDPAAKVKLED